ncbi:hypothetical protein TNCV_1262621 [Trichonephila clavipes]|nr:hypothetical protein TNCV_1262621 [Trichonephila clavipes]
MCSIALSCNRIVRERILRCDSRLFIYLSSARAWLLGHLTPNLSVPTNDIINRVFSKSSALGQVVVIHSGMAAEGAGLVSLPRQASGGILPKSHVWWLGESG